METKEAKREAACEMAYDKWVVPCANWEDITFRHPQDAFQSGFEAAFNSQQTEIDRLREVLNKLQYGHYGSEVSDICEAALGDSTK